MRLLEYLLSLARERSPELVPILEPYLDTARRLTGQGTVPPRDGSLIDEVLAGIDGADLLGGLREVPLYLRLGTVDERATLCTPLVPLPGGDMLKAGFERFWRVLFERRGDFPPVLARGPG